MPSSSAHSSTLPLLQLRRLSAPQHPIEASIERREDLTLVVTLSSTLSSEIEVGEQLLVSDDQGRRWRARVSAFEGGQLSLESRSLPRREARRFPRVRGAIALKIALFASASVQASAPRRWLDDGEWPVQPIEINPEMDFNPTGFGCTLPNTSAESAVIKKGSLLACLVGVYTAESRWRCLAEVIRAQDGELALMLLEPPSPLQHALADYLSKRQGLLLGEEEGAESAP